MIREKVFATEYNKALDKLLDIKLIDIKNDIVKRKELMVITDDNMAIEYKVNKHFYRSNTTSNWFTLYKIFKKSACNIITCNNA
ncbi:hypothetical protein NOVO_00670 [Rickettsiales bacterium Ac37b]|nr:hypothetical protein NOVO_00670 [Rickettsiales bacterium Ac37b]